MNCPNCLTKAVVFSKNKRNDNKQDVYLRCPLCKAQYKITFLMVKQPEEEINKYGKMVCLMEKYKDKPKREICELHSNIMRCSLSTSRNYYRIAKNKEIEKLNK